MKKFLVLALLAFPQAHPGRREKPLALDPVKQRQVSVAWSSGRKWAKDQAEHLYPSLKGIQLARPRQVEFVRMRKYAQYNLTVGVANQICEAYGISRKTLDAVAADPRSRSLPFVEEPTDFEGIRMAVGGDFGGVRTRFDPGKVIIPDKIAAKIGYKNPTPSDPDAPKPARRPRSIYMGEKPPGFPQAEWDRLHPPAAPADEREIDERARQAIKNMDEMESLTGSPRTPGS